MGLLVQLDLLNYTEKNMKFLIQSDETEFLELFLSRYASNGFYFKDEIRHINRQINDFRGFY